MMQLHSTGGGGFVGAVGPARPERGSYLPVRSDQSSDFPGVPAAEDKYVC